MLVRDRVAGEAAWGGGGEGDVARVGVGKLRAERGPPQRAYGASGDAVLKDGVASLFLIPQRSFLAGRER